MVKTKDIVTQALVAAVLCVISPFAIPVGPVPITLATFAVYMVATVKNTRTGLWAVVVYLALGMVGLPVFSGFSGGYSRLAGVTGGFLIGYIPCAYVAGKIVDRFEQHVFIFPVALTAGAVLCYTFGIAWFVVQSGSSIQNAIAVCVVPFIVPEVIKIAMASVIAPIIRRRITVL